MKNPIILSLLLTLFFAINVQGQSKLSWRKHAKLAEELYNKGQYADAAEHYRAAWKKKTKKKEYIEKAGECFYAIRDYRNAADSWQHVKDDLVAYPLIGLKYARCLKQNGEFEAASSELVSFQANYKGPDRTTVSNIVQNELRGCELAAQYGVKGSDDNIEIDYLSSNINTPENEFAPMPFGDEALYFSSTMGKRAEIYRSIKNGNIWSKATPIENFPKIDKDHFCNGSLTPDASRFYFTICQSAESWGGRTSQCALYVTRRVGKTWTKPERLPDYLNEVNTTTTQPYVVHDNDTEILYFASNRKGGMGGMDIWYTTREINSEANDFTLPINAGSKINTIGDEITPYYNQVEDAIYFASNGQVSIGGFDIFKAKGSKARWEQPENMGMPINSSADDFFFVKTTSGKGGFLVSNRTFEMEKVTTTDEDIFAFEYKENDQHWVAKGEVYNKENKDILKDVEVALYEIPNTGQRRFLDKIVTATGLYEFEVGPAKHYILEVQKEGFFPKSYEFDTREYTEYDDFGAPIYLEKLYEGYQGEVVSSNQGSRTTGDTSNSQDVNKPQPADGVAGTERKPTTPPNQRKEIYNPEMDIHGKTATGSGVEDSISSPKKGRPYYKIQIIALSKFNANQSRYNTVKKMGDLDTEYIPGRGLYRVLISDYPTINDAMDDLAKTRKYRDFRDAFIVEYRDGQRIRDIH